jgi:hypothetical protein
MFLCYVRYKGYTPFHIHFEKALPLKWLSLISMKFGTLKFASQREPMRNYSDVEV